ncbi:MAG: NAD(P)/FAD-dependent oxidoreductase [Candidatus Bathyarchaeia archaeon]
MENFSDVIIVGGGPSGSFCAFNLAKRKIEVTVFEEHSEVGVPCHCAGHLSINGLKNLGLYPLPKGVVENTFSGVKIHSPKGLEFSIRFNSPLTCVVNRALFDKYVASLAEKAGAYFSLKSRVERLIKDEGAAKGVEVKVNGKTAKAYGKVIVDAEGTSYRVLRQTGLFPPDRFVNCINAEVENVRDIELDTVEIFLGNAYAPGFYAWLIPLKRDKAKVGLGARMGNPKSLLQKLMHKHPAASRKLRKAKILHKSFHPIPLSGPVKAYSDGFLAIGDAAAQVKPTTGGGLVFGLNCAKIAADVVAEAIKQDDHSAKFLSVYQRRFMKLLNFDLKIMKGARKILDNVSDEKLDDILEFCNRIHANLDFSDLREIDFQGRTLLSAWRKPRLLTALTYFLVSSLAENLKHYQVKQVNNLNG